MIVDRMLKTHEYTLEVLYEVPLDELNDLERECIVKYETMFPNGLNQVEGGSIHTIPGHIREKMSKSMKGKPKSEKARKNMSESKKRLYATGFKSAFHGGMLTPESKKKISVSLKERYKSNPPNMSGLVEYYKTHDVWNKGIPCSEDMKKQISNKLKGQKLSEETRKKMSESRMGHPVSDETRCKIAKKLIDNGHAIKIYNIDTKVTYPTIQSAIRETGASESGIRLCINGKGKTSGGFHW